MINVYKIDIMRYNHLSADNQIRAILSTHTNINFNHS